MSHLRTVRSAVAVALVLPFAPGCDRTASGGNATSNRTTTAPAETSTAPQPDLVAVSNFDDTNVAAVLQSVHQRIAEQSQLAEHYAEWVALRTLSHELDASHSDALRVEQGLYQRLDLVPHASAVSQRIDADATRAIEALRGDRGGTFDQDYLDGQARTIHESIVQLDRVYAVAREPELKEEIARSRRDLVAGMRSITQLQQTMNGSVTNMQGK
jgi:hypothetical protein